MAPKGAVKDKETVEEGTADGGTEEDTTIEEGTTEDGTEAEGNGDGSEKKTRNMPTYMADKVSELPEDAGGGKGRANLYFDILTKVSEDPLEWYVIAEFKTPTGATGAAKSLREGERKLPNGEWEFEPRKCLNPTNPAAPKWSKLYARFLGNEEKDEK